MSHPRSSTKAFYELADGEWAVIIQRLLIEMSHL